MLEVAKQVEFNARQVVPRAASRALVTVVSETPVDKGQAVSNWITSLDSDSGDFYPGGLVPGQYGSTAEENRAAALQRGRAVLVMHRPGQQVYISNGTPYIQDLNDRPGGQFVQRAVAQAREDVRQVKLLKQSARELRLLARNERSRRAERHGGGGRRELAKLGARLGGGGR